LKCGRLLVPGYYQLIHPWLSSWVISVVISLVAKSLLVHWVAVELVVESLLGHWVAVEMCGYLWNVCLTVKDLELGNGKIWIIGWLILCCCLNEWLVLFCIFVCMGGWSGYISIVFIIINIILVYFLNYFTKNKSTKLQTISKPSIPKPQTPLTPPKTF
jgi:hypothetical protein